MKKRMENLPGCIRREIRKMRAEDNGLGLGSIECSETVIDVAWHRWAKRKSRAEISDAVLLVCYHCTREDTALRALLEEAAHLIRVYPCPSVVKK